MEDIIRYVVTGCKLARNLESNHAQLNGTAQLLEKCEEIAGAFVVACRGLRMVERHVEIHGQGPRNLGQEMEMEMEMEIPVDRGSCGSAAGGLGEAGGELRLPVFVPVGGGTGAGEGTSAVQKSRKRKDEAGKHTIEVAAPMHGNTDLPPDDGYTWRKYGQKEILGAQFPRGYYRCTHQRLYNCHAKKQVQRLDNNPRIFQVTYRGPHTCHMSSTAPASGIRRTASPRGWLSLDAVGPGGRDQQGDHGAHTVVDMADAMFNSSAGGGGDGIDSIFSG